MYFIEQIRKQFMNNIVNYDIEAGAAEEVTKPIEGEGTDVEEGLTTLGIETGEVASTMGDRAEELNAGVEALGNRAGATALTGDVEGGGKTTEVVGEQGDDKLGVNNGEVTPEQGETEKREEYTPLFEELSEKPPFNTLSPEQREEILASIVEEGLEIPEGMTQEEAFEEAFNEHLESEPTEDTERIDHILEEEGITLNEEQRAELTEYLKNIEDPTLQDIEDFLLEHNQTMVVEDNPGTPGNEAGAPDFLTQAYSNGESYSHLPSSGGSYSGENPYTGEVFQGNAGLNKEFYDVDKLRGEIPKDRLEQADKIAEEITQQLEGQGGNPENWLGALYRNAKNNPNFSQSHPVLLHNLSTATALVYANRRVQTVPATHGKGVGNVNGSGSTPVGSFALYGMPNGKYQARMGVRGLEPITANVSNESEQGAYDADPSAMGNANSDNRLIRIHESRGSRTLGCSGLPVETAKTMSQAVKSAGGGIMERFVSNPTG